MVNAVAYGAALEVGSGVAGVLEVLGVFLFD